MNFKNCLYREFLWWVRCPSLWWSLPPLIILVTMLPIFMISYSGMNLVDIEEMWDGLGQTYIHYIKPKASEFDVVQNIVDLTFGKIESFLTMPIEEIWRIYILPPIQIWGIFPLAMMVSPLAVVLFNRDRVNGYYKEWLLNGGRIFPLLFARFLVCSMALFLMYSLSVFIYTEVLSASSERPDLFRLSDGIWFFGVLCGGLITGMLTVVVNWYTCLISRNGSTEIYTALLISNGLVYGLSYYVFRIGWTLDVILCYNALAGAFCVFALFPLSKLMEREKFNFH